MSRRALRAAVVALAAPLGLAPAAVADRAVVWSGGIKPGELSRGVLVREDGRLQLMSASGTGAETLGPVIKPSAAALSSIRAALRGVRSAPPYTRPPEVRGGGYITAIVDGQGGGAAAIAIGAAPPGLNTIVERLNAALPDDRRLPAVVAARAPVTAAALPDDAPCSGGTDATTAVRSVSLEDAVRRGLVELSAKGGNQGDVVKVDGTWKPVPGDVTLRIPVEFIQDRPSVDVAGLASGLSQKMSQTIRTGPHAGTRINVELDFKMRTTAAPPTPCYHQVKLVESREFRSHVSHLGPKASGGEWGVSDATAFRHELWHFAGFDDRYDDIFRVGRRDIPLPQRGLEGAELAAELKRAGVKRSQGRLYGKPQKGHENDLMADRTKPISQDDLNAIAERAQIQVTGNPGDILLNKSPGEQNMITGRGLTFAIPYRGAVELNGMEAYCLDETKGSPTSGTRFDLMGAAAARPEPAYQALARVAQVIASRPEPPPFFGVAGAQFAVWRITDGLADPGADAQQILAEAQVPQDATFNAPHFANPNGGSPDTGVTTDTAPAAPLPPGPQLPPPPSPSLGSVSIVGGAPPARTRGVVVVRLTVGGAGALEQVRLALFRFAGKRGVLIFSSPALRFPAGETTFSLPVPKLKPGTHRLTVFSLTDRAFRQVTFKVGAVRGGDRGRHGRRP